MTATTVKIQDDTKFALDEFKDENETYDDVISKLIEEVKTKNIKQQLINAYKNMGKEDIAALEEWENSSAELQDGN